MASDAEFSAVIPFSATSRFQEALPILASGEGLLVIGRAARDVDARAAVGPALGGASPVLGALQQVAQRSRGASANLFRVELPAGHTIDNLVPAVGGGLRGIVRSADSAQIAGQARLFPVSAGAAGLALGPAVGLLALSTASQLLAQKQMSDKLEAIHADIRDVKERQAEQENAVLPQAERVLREVAHYLMDGVPVPTSTAADSSFGRLREMYEIRLARLEQWESVATKYEHKAEKHGEIDGPELMSDLKAKATEAFASQVERTYLTFALMARITVVARVEAALKDRNATMPNVDRMVAERLREIADEQERLVDVVGRLSGLPSTTGFWVKNSTEQKAIKNRAGLARLAHSLRKTPDAVPLLTPSRRPVVEIGRMSDGSFRVLQPK